MQSPDTIADVLNAAQLIETQTTSLLDQAPLTVQQREDLSFVREAVQQFQRITRSESEIIHDAPSAEEAQRVRHDLRNQLNIIAGFTRLLVKQLPDNLLLHMMAIRQIHETAQTLLERVDRIE
jgi:nitrogen-specific signal transduction histidine kinase